MPAGGDPADMLPDLAKGCGFIAIATVLALVGLGALLAGLL